MSSRERWLRAVLIVWVVVGSVLLAWAMARLFEPVAEGLPVWCTLVGG